MSGLWSFFGGLASAGAGIFNGIKDRNLQGQIAALNYLSQKKTNETNKEINQANLDFNAAQTQAQWERDDNAHQREVADLVAAGLSPLASLNGAQTSSPLGAPSAIAMQAPQVDGTGMLQSSLGITNSIMDSLELAERFKHNTKVDNQSDQKLLIEGQKLELSAKELDLNNRKLEQQIKHETSLIKLEDDRLNELKRHNLIDERNQTDELTRKKIADESQRYFEEVRKQTGGRQIPTKTYKDLNDYLSYRDIRNKAYEELIDAFKDAKSSTSASGSVNISYSKLLSIFGNSKSNSNGLGVSGSGSHSYDKTFNYEQAIEAFNNRYPYPVYYTGSYNYSR